MAENIAVVPGSWLADQIRKRVDELLELVSLRPAEYRERLPKALSGGQRQRIGLARALAARPKIMLMDEPFGAIDPINRDRLQDEYKKIHRDLGLTTVMVTHDMTEALLMADRIAAMSGGRLIRVGHAARAADRSRRSLCRRTDGKPQATGPATGNVALIYWDAMISERFLQQLRFLPDNLSNHLIITMIPLVLSLAISLPLAILLVRRKSLRYPVIAVVSVIQTIPSLALLALMVPLLAGIAILADRFLGVEFSALGFYPTIIALTLYGIMPMLRNTVTGILGVDPAMIEAARGMGMTPGQMLRKVELRLAAPVIIAGIRTATVWVVGTATLATPVGQRCLGNYIFRGLQTRNWIAVLFGCVSAGVVAVVLDSLIGVLERAAAERRRGLAAAAGITLALIFGFGLFAPGVLAFMQKRLHENPAVEVVEAGQGAAKGKAGTDAERRPTPDRIEGVYGTIYSIMFDPWRLKRAGFTVRQKESLGSAIAFDALAKNQIDCLIDYSGTIWANYMKRGKADKNWKVQAEVIGWLAEKHGIVASARSGSRTPMPWPCSRERAESLGIKTIADLARHARTLIIGGEYEFFGRPEWQSHPVELRSRRSPAGGLRPDVHVRGRGQGGSGRDLGLHDRRSDRGI